MGNALIAPSDAKFEHEPEELVTQFKVCLEVFVPVEDKDSIDQTARARIEMEHEVVLEWSVRLLSHNIAALLEFAPSTSSLVSLIYD